MRAPCMNCPDRCPEPNCHITCQRYIDSVKKQKTDFAEEKLNRELNYLDNRRYYRNQHKRYKG